MRIEYRAEEHAVAHLDQTTWRPIVTLGLHRPTGGIVSVEAMLDTGATSSVFPLCLADIFGATLSTTTQLVAGAGKKPVFTALIRLTLNSPDSPSIGWDWTERVLFSDVRMASGGVLGGPFFTQFQVNLRLAKGIFTIEDDKSGFRGIARKPPHHK